MISDETFPTIGILGGGQLGRMLAFDAIRMGFRVRFLAPGSDGPMEGLGEGVAGDWYDPEVMATFGEPCSVITVESEWAPAEVAAGVFGDRVPVRPSPQTLDVIRHKGRQKKHLAEAGLPVPEFASCDTFEAALRAARTFGFPVLAKRFTRSYDGYGNATVQSESGLRMAWDTLAGDDGLLIEAFVPFEHELSVLVARRPGGQYVVYPVAYTEQREHRCHVVVVPAEADPAVLAEARRVAVAAVEAVDGVGITAVELFQLSDGRVLINELAPRPHNTGHYTIEGCYTSQFENHLRAILDWPLGSPELREPFAVMVNVLGERVGKAGAMSLREAMDVPGVTIHIYGKADVVPGRKMGHVTVTGHRRAEIRYRAERAASLIRL